MTTMEARETYCPLLVAIQKMFPSITCKPYCIACTCMMWRWCDPEVRNEGYCGLAGKEGAE